MVVVRETIGHKDTRLARNCTRTSWRWSIEKLRVVTRSRCVTLPLLPSFIKEPRFAGSRTYSIIQPFTPDTAPRPLDDGRGVHVLFLLPPPAGLYVDALDRRRDGLRTGLVPAREAERQVPEEAGPDLLGLSERAGGRRGRAALQRAPDAQAAREPRRLGRRARQWRAGAHQRGSSAPADAFIRSDQSARACASLALSPLLPGGGQLLICSSPSPFLHGVVVLPDRDCCVL